MASDRAIALTTTLYPGACVMREEQQWGRRIVVAGFPDDGTYDWFVFGDEGNLVAHSEAQYGSIAAALRDGLLYETTGKILCGGHRKGEAYFLGLSEWVIA